MTKDAITEQNSADRAGWMRAMEGAIRRVLGAGIATLARFGIGDKVTFTHDYNAKAIQSSLGTGAVPQTTSGPNIRVSRTELYQPYIDDGNNESNAGILVNSLGLHNTTQQVMGILGISQSYGMTAAEKATWDAAHPTTPANNDCVGVAGIGFSQGTNRGGGAGGFFYGSRAASAGSCSVMEGRTNNGAGVAAQIFTTGPSDCTGFVATAGGGTACGDAFVAHSSDGGTTKYKVGFHTTTLGPTEESVLIDDTATYAFRDRGTHTLGVDLASGTYSQSAVRVGKGHWYTSLNNAGAADINLIGKENTAADRVSIGNGVFFIDPASSHYAIVQAAVPTGVLGTGAGTGAGTAPTFTIVGNDIEGRIDLVTGTQVPAAAATVITVTYRTVFAAVPLAVMIVPVSAASQALARNQDIYSSFGGLTTGVFTITSGAAALAISTTYRWAYKVIPA